MTAGADGWHHMKRVESSDAVELGELTLIVSHIEGAILNLRLYEGDDLDRLPDGAGPAVRAALFRDAVIQFVECFGKAPKLDKAAIYGAVAGGPAYFQYLLDLRDNYAAHNHGPLRQCEVVVALAPIDEGGGVIGQGEFALTYSGPKQADVPAMRSFLSLALRTAALRVEQLQELISTSVGQLTTEQLDSLPNASIRPPRPDAIRTSRAKHRKAAS